jgi:xanthine/CO dehydrogenase XdhC/CoxF family maturation factor
MSSSIEDPSCAVAHGDEAPRVAGRVLVAIFASPVAGYLLRYARDAGYRTVLAEPDPERAKTLLDVVDDAAETVVDQPDSPADVVATDHHRAELGPMLRDALASNARWIGVMGNPRHPGPHIAALTELGVAAGEIARVQRPIGLNIGSRTPPEIAISTLAGLIANRNERPGGFSF